MNPACFKCIWKCSHHDVIASMPNLLLVSLFFHPSVFEIMELNLLAAEESFSSRLCTASDSSLTQTSFAFFAVSFRCSRWVRTTSWKTYFLSSALTHLKKRFTVGNFSNLSLWILAKFCFVWDMSTWASTKSTSLLWKFLTIVWLGLESQ